MTTLIVAEKNKAAIAIAEALGKTNRLKQSSINIYQVKSRDLYIIPLRGHLLAYKNVGIYKNWSKSNPRDIITDPNSIKKIPLKHAYPYISALEGYAKLCDRCIISTDADIEGVNIGLFDAYPFIKKGNPNISVSQMWLSSLQGNEIRNKFHNLIPPKWSWGETGEARAIIDAIIGFSATRQISSLLKPVLKSYNKFFTSIGRVQTSLLYLIYLREVEIKNFKSEAYYIIDAALDVNSYSIIAHHEKNPFKQDQKDQAINIYQSIQNISHAKIINTKGEQRIKKPPIPLNTSKALILITKQLKIPANLALNTLNSLYLKKIITYPRTDSDVYKSDFNHVQYLQDFSTHSAYGQYTSQLLKQNRIIPSRGKKDAGDHPPITPIVSLEGGHSSFKNDLERKVYDLIARSYLALFGENAIELHRGLRLSIKEEPFNSKLNSLLHEGFFEIAPFLKSKYDPQISLHGDTLPVNNINLSEKTTQPPPRYTDTTLLKLMESKKLGTKATRPQMIEILQERGLIYREKGTYFISDLGDLLISNLIGIWKPFLEPSFTSYIEAELEKIKTHQNSMNTFLNNTKDTFLKMFDKLINNMEELRDKIEEHKREIQHPTKFEPKPKRERFTPNNCPFCKSAPMKLVTTRKKKRFLACSEPTCKRTMTVPQRGRIVFLKDTCKICGFTIFKVVSTKNKRSFTYYMCPNCWNSGLKDKMKNGEGFCSNCKNYLIKNEKCIKK